MKFIPPSQRPSPPERSTLPEQRAAVAHPSIARRWLLLLACVALGLAIGFIGEGITSESMWFLAVPVCIAIGWLFVANPDECVTPLSSTGKEDSTSN
jgi:hypothetical protein